jgi:hypothetical protein
MSMPNHPATRLKTKDERTAFMRMNLRHGVWVLAVEVGIGVSGVTVLATGGSIFPGPRRRPRLEPRPGLLEKHKDTSKVCVKGRMTRRTTGITARNGTSKKTKTRKRMRPATRRATAIEVLAFSEDPLANGGRDLKSVG